MQIPTKILFRQERDFGEVLNVTFQFLRQNAGLLVKSLLFIAGPALALSVIISPYGGASGLLFNPAELQTLETEAGRGFFFVRVIAGVVLSLLGSVLGVAVVNEAMVLYREQGPGGFEVEDVWRRSRRSVWKVLGTVLLLGLLFGVAAVIVLVPCLGALAYLVGLVYFGVVFSLAFIAQAQEGAGVVASLGRSRELVREHFWPTAGVVFVSGIVYYALSVCFAVPSLVVGGLTAFHGIEGEASPGVYRVLMTLFGVVASLGSLLLYAIPLVAVAFQYFSLVEQKERVGLMERVEAVERAAQTSEPTSAAPEARWQPPLGPIAPPEDAADEAALHGRPTSGRPGQQAEADVRERDADDAGRPA